MTTNELLKKAKKEKVSVGEKYAYMVVKDTKWGKSGYIFFNWRENDNGTVDEVEPYGGAWATYKVGEEAVKIIRNRTQTITETFRLAKVK